MDKLQDMQDVSLELLAVVPRTLGEAEALAESIEQAVQQETAGSISNLAVDVRDDGVILHGSCSSYYQKQLAQHAAMAVPGGLKLINAIEVD
jgi:osmotically-inducible protein OsmY